MSIYKQTLINKYITVKTLVVHPKDHTTDFLKPIYKTVINPYVITGGVDDLKIKQYLKDSDRALMMGHGSPGGLFSIGKFKTGTYAIGPWCVDELQPKTENVYIWCNADKFVNQYKLKGFYSGMFISEVSEAIFCGLDNVSQDEVTESNEVFSVLLGEVINLPKAKLYKSIKDRYGELAKKNPVAAYNWKRLYVA